MTQKAAGHDVPPPPAKVPIVVCLGHVDIDGGVTAISPPHSGRVVASSHRKRGRRSRGILLKLDDHTARFDAEQARAEVETAKLRLAPGGTGPETAADTDRAIASGSGIGRVQTGGRPASAERQQELLKINNANFEDVRAAESQVKEQEALVRAAKEKLIETEQTDASLPVREAKADHCRPRRPGPRGRLCVEQCEVRAPSAGTVLRVQTSPGEITGGTGTAGADSVLPGSAVRRSGGSGTGIRPPAGGRPESTGRR